jgi:non-specific serine/threonine protein kinase/serine/threonine-protein kinase
MDMTPESWKQVKELFDSALDQPPAQRPDFLKEQCPDDALRREVEKLLENYAEAGAFLSTPAMNPRVAIPREIADTHPIGDSGSNGTGGVATSSAVRLGAALGNYRILSRLGEGGMGQVWLAEQTAPLQRQVALKLIRVGMYDDSVLQRFASERQSLASMSHPSIAKVFDAGTTPDGQPYFAMEYVPGLPITEYYDKNKLTIRERLELFVQVCEGVQHAHQKAIIHRDLKPANILVVEVDGKPMPRIIDFGLAKATARSPSGKDHLTQVGMFMGTPGYMSPEQANPELPDIDTRTDVYSLGVILYELLTGCIPSDVQRGDQSLAEQLKRLREQDPPLPSTKVRSDRDGSSVKAEERGTDPGQLVSLLRGDLDWIAMKALERDRARRYGTPSELATDIGHYLRHEPVTARPASAAYQVGKYVRRHRFGVAVAATMVALLAGFAVMQAIQLRRTTRERDRANRITDFMVGMFKVSDPSEARGNQITAREILDKASRDIHAGLSRDPEVQAQMMSVMGGVYDNLGLYPQAASLYGDAVEVRKRVLGPENPDTLRSMHGLARPLREQGKYAEAEKLQRETLDIQRRVLKPDHPDTLASTTELAIILYNQARYPEAEKLAQKALADERRILGNEASETLWSMDVLASIYFDENRLADSEQLYREAVDTRRRVLGPDHPDTLSVMDGYATTLATEHRNDEAEKLLRETLSIRQRVLGPDHRDTVMSMNNLSTMLFMEGRYDEADKLERQTLDIQRRVLGPNHPDTAMSIYNLGGIALHEGRPDEALSLLREAVDHGLAPNIALHMEKDTDLESLHTDPRFAALIAHAKEHAGGTQKTKP